MIRYVSTLEGISPKQLAGFFEGWPNPPSPETHLELLRRSGEIVLAIDDETNTVTGFINAITDNVLCAYIPLLEVRTSYRRRGIGKELVRRMLNRLEGIYMIDLLCDEELQPFYESLGMCAATGMMMRNFENQSGRRR